MENSSYRKIMTHYHKIKLLNQVKLHEPNSHKFSITHLKLNIYATNSKHWTRSDVKT